jgi:hypothetical protein
MSNLIAHAKRELEVFGDEPMVNDAVMQLVRAFAGQGHSGFSAEHVLGLFNRVARFEPLRPLTGEDSEWERVEGDMLQNRRCSRVFKDAEGAFDIEGRIFREPDGCCFTSADSWVPVTFPYTPKSEYVDVPKQREETA